uniref:Fungal lipase-type domain-containing protein n=1 Tax=Nelumbo nucifera TaxID=4432 RepID=A0A822Y1L6_NELNU|nr:TPA_asm: hypothetical protein HUJ06_026865 [Nelumbo nucifera]
MANVNPNRVTVRPCMRLCSPGQSKFGQVKLPEMSGCSSSSRHSITASMIAPTVLTAMAETSSGLSHVWREIQGSDNWEDLIEPLDPLLREEIVRYGEFATGCYKAFDLDPTSKRYLNCKYGKKNILREVGLENSGYQVTKYIYATPDISVPIQNAGTCCGRWIGYVAVSSDDAVKTLGRRDVLVTFRGTVTNTEWIANFMSSLTPARLDPHNPRPNVKVESGFLGLYTSEDGSCKFGVGSCREQLLSEISRIINHYKDEEMSITLVGHSMGSALALLLAYDISELGLNTDHSNRQIPVTVYSFAGPRVGNSDFKERCDELGVKVLRIVNVNDPITKLPGVVFNENLRVLGGRYELPWSCSCYAHVGVELSLDFFQMENPSCVHDLESYIMLLKCPKQMQVQKDRIRNELLNKAREWLWMSAQKLEYSWPWIFPLRNAGSFVQSQRT